MSLSTVLDVLTSPSFILKSIYIILLIKIIFTSISIGEENQKEISKIKKKLNID